MNRDGQRLFRVPLPDAMQIKLAFDVGGLGHGEPRLTLLIQQLRLAVELALLLRGSVGEERVHLRDDVAVEHAGEDAALQRAARPS